MEKELLRFQAENRLCGTILRLSWLIAAGAFVPVLMYGFLFGAALGVALRVLFLVLFVIITFGAILANESFRNLFRAENLEQIEAMTRDVVIFYQSLMPVFLTLSAVFLALNVFFIVKNGSPRTGRLASAVLSALFTLIAALLYYMVALEVAA